LGIVFFVLEFFQVLVVDTIRVWHIFLVPPVIARLVAAQEKNRGAAWVENVQNTVWASLMLQVEWPRLPMPQYYYNL
jgi:hypothetical protein